jgi:nitroimidazol reductase NimA-like FMN-containing flavoprotein (pyridoxamine 5'-phosphate oxidase superfamily)
MRRADREITDINEKLEIMGRCKVCRLGLSDKGQPYVVPLNFGYTCEGGALSLYFHGALEGRKLDIIKENNRACFEIDCGHELIKGERACDYGFAFESVIGSGIIEILYTTEEKIFGLKALMKHQSGREFSFGEKDVEAVAVLRMTVEEFTGKRKALPGQHASPPPG